MKLAVLGFVIVIVAATAYAQTADQGLHGTADISVGKFLVATDDLMDPRFTQSVILILQHDSDGTVGIIINQPSKLKVTEAFPKIEKLQKSTDSIYRGGPMDIGRVFILARTKPDEKQHLVRVLDDVAVTGDLEGIIDRIEVSGWSKKVRVIAGYAGWAAGQLQDEVRAGAWKILPADATTIFEADPSKIWPDLKDKSNLIQTQLR